MNIIPSTLSIVLILPLLLVGLAASAEKNSAKVLFDFSNAESENWRIVNDGVMGGVSKSQFQVDSGRAVFSGSVSLENNGGFASTRTFAEFKLEDYHGVLLRVRGDGKTYQLRLRTDDRMDGMSYRCHFETTVDEWTTIKLPFSEFEPVFRGRVLQNVEPLDPSKIQQLGFLIADKQEGSFRLEIEWIEAYKQ